MGCPLMGVYGRVIPTEHVLLNLAKFNSEKNARPSSLSGEEQCAEPNNGKLIQLGSVTVALLFLISKQA